MHASNLLKAVLKPRNLSTNSSKKSNSGSAQGNSGPLGKRGLSTNNILPSASLTTKKMTCMCSPTSHPGSFRCRFHRAQQQAGVVALPSSPRGGASSILAPPRKCDEQSPKDSGVFNEVNRTLPSRPASMARSPSGRTSRLNRMSLRGDEEEEVAAISGNEECMRNLKLVASTGSKLSSQEKRTIRAMLDIPNIHTSFCQSTSRVALDAFDRGMTRRTVEGEQSENEEEVGMVIFGTEYLED